MADRSQYRLDEVYKKRTAIFAPDDICAMAVVDSYIGSTEKAEAMIAKANRHETLLEAAEALETLLYACGGATLSNGQTIVESNPGIKAAAAPAKAKSIAATL